MIKNNMQYDIIIDVRTPEEVMQEKVKGSINIDIYSEQFLEKINQLDKNKKYLLYCRSGNRSGQAESLMVQLGFKDVKNIGGIAEVRELFEME